jgi:hypothetical protein
MNMFNVLAVFHPQVADSSQCALQVRTVNDTLSRTGSFVVPGWGGVVVWNPPQCVADTAADHLSGSVIATPLTTKALRPLMGVLAAQVRCAPPRVTAGLPAHACPRRQLNVASQHVAGRER